MSTDPERRLFVAWRRPEGLIVPVGLLIQQEGLEGPEFVFAYLKGAERNAGFTGLPGLPGLHERYVSPVLFPVFANRVMPRERADYGAFVEHLDLSIEADPFEVLSRSEGIRTTDRIEVFPDAERSVEGDLVTRFFARGIRHRADAAEAVDDLRAGDELQLVDEPDNAVNPRAMLLHTRTGRCVGWAPDYLLDLLHELRQLNDELPRITAEHVNPSSVAPHLRLLCHAEAPWPEGYQPFSGPDFQLLA